MREFKPKLRLWFIDENNNRHEILVSDEYEAELYIKSINLGKIEENDPFLSWKDYGLDELINNIWMPYKNANPKLLKKLHRNLKIGL